MNAAEALNKLADLFGILPAYKDLGGQLHTTSPDTQRALLCANGLDVSSEVSVLAVLKEIVRSNAERLFPEELIVESNCAHVLGFGQNANWSLTCTETGDCVALGRANNAIELPAIPSGLYDLVVVLQGRSETITVIAAPPRAPSIDEVANTDRLWGINAALYGLGGNNRLGNFGDLAEYGAVLSRAGGGFLGVNPLHALGHMSQDVISPYSPSSRSALNTSHIALDQIPGMTRTSGFDAKATGPSLKEDAGRCIDYGAHNTAHHAALEALFVAFCTGADSASKREFASFEPIADAQAAAFSMYEAISEQEGPDWRQWPALLRVADNVALRQIAQSKAGRIEFHRWLQWVADKQLASTQSNLLHSGMPLGLYLDLAVGARRGGAESWCEADAIAQGVSVGAPPDHLSPAGQNWDLAAFAPHRLKGQKYAAYRRILRSCMRHAGVLRIDHVLGLNRSFWIPDDGSPGGYVSQPMEALSAIIRIEAERANTLIIGEDLGLVPEGFRARMRAQGFYGYSVVQYEKTKEGAFRQPEDYEPQILACFGTHDTPTLQGFRTGRDIEWWRTLGWISEKTATKARIDRRAEVKGIIELGSRQDGYAGDHVSASDKDVSVAVHGALASSPSALVSVQLDDILFNVETQNLPGTIDQHPNWRRNYATTPEDLSANAHLNAISGWMRDAGRASADDTEEEVGK